MKKMIMIVTAFVAMTVFGHDGWNHMLGTEIIRGVSYILGGAVRPAPVVVTPTATTVPGTTTVYTTIPAFTYGYYNNVYCPYYDGYYYYNNAWIWGGIGIRRPIPTWIPPYRPYHGYGPRIAPRPFGPPPPIHHGPVPHHGGMMRPPMGGGHHSGGMHRGGMPRGGGHHGGPRR